MNREIFSSLSSFIKKSWIPIIVIAICCILKGYMLYAAIAIIVLCIFFSSIEIGFCWSLFLIPNIRLFDDIGITFTVNILMLLPFIKYIYVKRFRLPRLSCIGSGLFVLIEGLHIVILGNYSSVFPSLSCILGFTYCSSLTLDKSVQIERDNMFWALTSGIIFSFLIYLVCEYNYEGSIIMFAINGHRYYGYANDPNYYALYICLTISILLGTKRKSILHLFALGALLLIGIFTTSKMCYLIMTLELLAMIFIVLTLRLNPWSTTGVGLRNRKFIVASLLSIFAVCCIFYKYVIKLIQMFLDRAGAGVLTLNSLTTGRWGLLINYIKILFENPIALIFGYGFSYNKYLGEISGRVVHNTYLDLILSWGILGAIIFIIIVYYWFKRCSYNKKISLIELLPIFVLGLSIFGLSCLSASMFFVVISVTLLYLKTGPDKIEC